MHRMADSGILQGRSDGTFGPRDFLTRAETAAAGKNKVSGADGGIGREKLDLRGNENYRNKS